jgi:hypothetical protein
MTLGLAALAVTGCRPAVRTEAEPSISGLVVRNSSQFDINVYALPTPESKPLWLGTVPATGVRSLPIYARALQGDRNLTVRTQAIGSSRSWTSASVVVNGTVFAVLDLFANSAGDCSESRLYTADTREAGPIMW